jgi:hypothetical protein
VLSANGTAPARMTVARFHAARTCGYDGIVTELVLAFPPESEGATPSSHMPVVASLTDATFIGGAGHLRPPLSRQAGLELLNRVVKQAERSATLLRPLRLDPDQAADAGEVVPLGFSYGVGFRARFITSAGDTVLVTGIANTDPELNKLRWIVQPRRIRLKGGMIPRTTAGVRYSLRGILAAYGIVILVDEIADVSPRDSRATAIDVDARRIVAAQPLALRCP